MEVWTQPHPTAGRCISISSCALLCKCWSQKNMVIVGISKPRWQRTWFLLLCVWTDSQCKPYHTVYMLERRAHMLTWQLTSREREAGSHHAQAWYKTILLNVKAAVQKNVLARVEWIVSFFYTVAIKGDANLSLLSDAQKNPKHVQVWDCERPSWRSEFQVMMWWVGGSIVNLFKKKKNVFYTKMCCASSVAPVRNSSAQSPEREPVCVTVRLQLLERSGEG